MGYIGYKSTFCLLVATLLTFIHYLRQVLINSQKLFTAAFSSKFAIKRPLVIPSHVNHVATLPCECFGPGNGCSSATNVNVVVLVLGVVVIRFSIP